MNASLPFIHIYESKFREAGHLCETHCKPRSGAAVGCMSALLYGSAKRDLFIPAAVDSV